MRGRPATDESAAYYTRYIEQAEGDDVVALLAAQLNQVTELCSAISEAKSLDRYAPDKWSIRQVLSHLSDAERLFAFRAFWFARRFDSALPSFDEKISAEAAQADRISWADHVAEFQALRTATVALFRGLPDAAWMQTGTASGNSFTVRSIAWIIAGHTAHHVRILRERYL